MLMRTEEGVHQAPVGNVRGTRIGVGFMGANPARGWVSSPHIPALRSVRPFTLAAVSTVCPGHTQQARRLYRVPLAFDTHLAMLERPEVDFAVVAVKVPLHFELAEATLNAGKALYCEWPLASTLDEAERLAALARQRDAYACVGLPARSAPVVEHVRSLLAAGYVGTVLSSSIIASGCHWGADVLSRHSYVLDRKNGATMLTIPFGHTLDAFCSVLGEFEQLNATLATRRREVRVSDGKGHVTSNVADQICVTGTLEGGAVASVHFRGGASRGTNFLWEINGSEGDLMIEGDLGHIQTMPLRLKGARGGMRRVLDLPVAVPDQARHLGTPESASLNLARAYGRVAEDLMLGTRHAPSLDEAVIRHRMIDAVATAARTGCRQEYDRAPPGHV